jgi:LacI family transcriptional regulator
MVADPTEHSGAERIQGYQATMSGHGLAGEVRVVPAPLTEQGGSNVTGELLASPDAVTAVFAGNDVCAFGVIDALAEHGIRVPLDMSVVGYDNTPLAALRTISLTTVDQFATEIGARGMQCVLARLKRRDAPARRVTVPPRLVERSTTAPSRDAGRSLPRAARAGAALRGAAQNSS